MKFLILATLFVCGYAIKPRIYYVEFNEYPSYDLKKNFEEIYSYMSEATLQQNKDRLEEIFGVSVHDLMSRPLNKQVKEDVCKYVTVEFYKGLGHDLPSGIKISNTYNVNLSGMSQEEKLDYLRAVSEVINERIRAKLEESTIPTTRVYHVEYSYYPHHPHTDVKTHHEEIENYMVQQFIIQNKVLLENRFNVNLDGIMARKVHKKIVEDVKSYLVVEFSHEIGFALPPAATVTNTYPINLSGKTSEDILDYLRACLEIVEESIHKKLEELEG